MEGITCCAAKNLFQVSWQHIEFERLFQIFILHPRFSRHIEFRVKRVEILTVQIVLNNS